MLFLQRTDSTRFQIIESYPDGNIRIVDHFRDDRGFNAKQLIEATKADWPDWQVMDPDNTPIRIRQLTDCEVLR